MLGHLTDKYIVGAYYLAFLLALCIELRRM